MPNSNQKRAELSWRFRGLFRYTWNKLDSAKPFLQC